MSDILPVSTGIGFNNGNGFGADTMGAFAGALFGSWFGDAWGGNWGNRGDAAAATGFSTQILNDGINAIQNSVNNMNTNLSSGLCNLGYQTLDQSTRNVIANMQGLPLLAMKPAAIRMQSSLLLMVLALSCRNAAAQLRDWLKEKLVQLVS